MTVAVKSILHCFSCFTLLLVTYRSVESTQVIEQYSPNSVEQVLQLSRRSIHDLLGKIRLDRTLRRRKYERDKRLLLLYKRASVNDSDDDEKEDASGYSEEDDRRDVIRGGGRAKVITHKGVAHHRTHKHDFGRKKKTHIIHSLRNVTPIMGSDSAAKVGLETNSKTDTSLLNTREGEYESTEVPVILKQFHSTWHGENSEVSKFSNQVAQHTIEKVSDDKKDRIGEGSRQRRVVNVEATGDENSDGSGDAEGKVPKASDGTDTEASGENTADAANQYSSGDALNEKEDDKSFIDKLGNAKSINENIEATFVHADGKSKDRDLKSDKATETLQDSEAESDKTSTEEDTTETMKKSDNSTTQNNSTSPNLKANAKDTTRSAEYRKIKHVSTFSPKSFSDMIVEDVMKNKGDNRRLPARNTDLEVVAQRLNNPGTQPLIEFETMHQPVTGQRILPFLGNRQTSKDFQSPKQAPFVSKTTQKYNKLLKPRHTHHYRHHSHHIYPNSNASSISESNSNVLKRRLVSRPITLKPKLPYYFPVKASVSTNRRLIPALAGEPKPLPAGQPGVQEVVPAQSMIGTKDMDHLPVRTGYVAARLSTKPFVPPPKPTIYDKILKTVTKLGRQEGIKPSTPLDTNKATSFLNSYYRHVKELSQDPQLIDPAFLNSSVSDNEAMSVPKLEKATNYSQPKQDIAYNVPYNILPNNAPNNRLTNATSYGGSLGQYYSTNNVGYEAADRRGVKSTKKTMSKTKQPMKCYKGHCERLRKYADVSGSKKDVLIGQLVPNMDPEDQGGGELDVSEINGAQLLEESQAVDGVETEEESEEEKKEELKGNKRVFTRYTNSDLLKAINNQQQDASSQAPTEEGAENVEAAGGDYIRMLGVTSDPSLTDTSQSEARGLSASESIPRSPVLNLMGGAHDLEETTDGSFFPLPAERKSSVVLSAKHLNPMETIGRPAQIRSKYFTSPKTEQRNVLGEEKYYNLDEYGRRRKSDSEIPLAELVDNTDVSQSDVVDSTPQANAISSLDDSNKLPPHAIELNEFQRNKQSEINIVQDIENKEFQEYLQSVKSKEATKDKEFQEYIQSYKNKDAMAVEKAAKKDKYAVPEVVPVNEYRQENRRGRNYGISVARSAPYKAVRRNGGIESYPQKVSSDYGAAQVLSAEEYASPEKKTIDYSFAKSPAVNEYTLSSEESNNYALAHNKKSSFDESSDTFNPSLKGTIEKEIPTAFNKYVVAESSPKDIGGGEEVPVNYESAFARETEQPVNRIANAEISHPQSVYQEKQTIEYGPTNDRTPTVKEDHINQVESAEGLGIQYDLAADTEKSAHSVRRTVNDWRNEAISEAAIPYTTANNGLENLGYNMKEYTTPETASYNARQRSAYLAKKRYQAAIAAKKQFNRRAATPERLMTMTQNPSMLSTSSVYMKPVGTALNVKSPPVENVEQDVSDLDNENYELSKLIKGQIQDPTSFDQSNILRSEQNRKTMVERTRSHARNIDQSLTSNPWENSIFSRASAPVVSEMRGNLDERGALIGESYMNFGKRTVDENNLPEIYDSERVYNEAKNLIPVMKNKRFNNISTEGRKNNNRLLQRKGAITQRNILLHRNKTFVTPLSGVDSALPAIKRNIGVHRIAVTNATKKMEVPNFSDLGSTRTMDFEESANLLSGVDTPLPIRTKDGIRSVPGDTKNKITGTQDEYVKDSKIRLLKKLAATKEDLLADRKPNRERIEDEPSSTFIHKDSSPNDVADHSYLDELTAHERKLFKINKIKQDNEMNIVADEEMAEKKQLNTESDPGIEGDVGEDKKLADIIAHAAKFSPDIIAHAIKISPEIIAHATKINPEKVFIKTPELEADPNIKERNETVAMTGAAVLTADPFKGMKENVKQKAKQEPQLIETEEKIFPKVEGGENELNETTDTKKAKSEDKKNKETTQKTPGKIHEANTQQDENGDNDAKKLEALERELKKSEEKKILKVGSIQSKLKEMAGLDSKDLEAEVTDVTKTTEKVSKKLVSNKQTDKEIALSSTERVELEEKKVKEFAAKEWQKHYSAEKATGFIGKGGKKNFEKNFEKKGADFTSKEGQQAFDESKSKELSKETFRTQKEFEVSKEKEASNKEIQKEFDESNVKEASNKEAQKELDESKGKEMSNKKARKELDESKAKEASNKEIQKEFDEANVKETSNKEAQKGLDESKVKEVSPKETEKEKDDGKYVSNKERQKESAESKTKEVPNEEMQKQSDETNPKDSTEKENENQNNVKEYAEKERKGKFHVKKVKESNKEEGQKVEFNKEDDKFRDNNEKLQEKEEEKALAEEKKLKQTVKYSAQKTESNETAPNDMNENESTGEGVKTMKPDDKNKNETGSKELDETKSLTTGTDKGPIDSQNNNKDPKKTDATKEEPTGMIEGEKEKGQADQKVDQTVSKDEPAEMMEVEKEKGLSDQKVVTLTAQEIRNHRDGKKATSVSEFKEKKHKEDLEKNKADENKLGEEPTAGAEKSENAQGEHEAKSAQDFERIVELQEKKAKSRKKGTKGAASEEEGKIKETSAKETPVTDSEKEGIKEATDNPSGPVEGNVKEQAPALGSEEPKNMEDTKQVQLGGDLDEKKEKYLERQQMENEAKEEKDAEEESEKEANKTEGNTEVEAEKEAEKMIEKGELKGSNTKDIDADKGAAAMESGDEKNETSGERKPMMIANKKKSQEAQEEEMRYNKDTDRKRKGSNDEAESITEAEGKKLKEATENADSMLDLKESKLKDTLRKIVSSEASDDKKVNGNEESSESKGESLNKELGSLGPTGKAADPEEKKLKELLNKKVEEIMERFRKEKETGQQQAGNEQSNMNKNEETAQQEGQRTTKDSEESEHNEALSEGKSIKEGIDDYEKTGDKQELTSEVNSDLKQDIDGYHNKTDAAYTKNVIGEMPNPFADIGSIPDGPAYDDKKVKEAKLTESKDINAELAEIIRSQKVGAETTLHAAASKTQHASARDSLPKVNHEHTSSQVSKRGFYRYTRLKD